MNQVQICHFISSFVANGSWNEFEESYRPWLPFYNFEAVSIIPIAIVTFTFFMVLKYNKINLLAYPIAILTSTFIPLGINYVIWMIIDGFGFFYTITYFISFFIIMRLSYNFSCSFLQNMEDS